VVEVEKVHVTTGNPVIAFAGELDMATAHAMHTAFEPWIRAGGPVVVDLSEVTFMDSTGIHALLKAAKPSATAAASSSTERMDR
jgi:anti-anti-sigma factor